MTSDHKWVIIGGRIDGLHQRQPFAAFQESDNNQNVFVIDPVTDQTWLAGLNTLSTPLFEQLQSTNQQFIQRDSTLYIVGGYVDALNLVEKGDTTDVVVLMNEKRETLQVIFD